MPPRRAIYGVTLLAALLAPPTRAQRPADPPATAPALDAARRVQFIAEQQAAVVEMMSTKDVARVDPRPPGSLVRLEVADGRLVARVIASGLADDVVMQTAGGDGAIHLRQINIPGDGGPSFTALQFIMRRFDARSLRTLDVELYPIPGRMNLVITIEVPLTTTKAELIEQSDAFAIDEGPGSPAARAMLDQSPSEDAADPMPPAHAALEGGSFVDLVERHHDDVLALLGEGLSTLRSMQALSGVSDAEARAALAPPIATDAAARRTLDAILARLARDGSAAVPEQRARLRALGPAAAMAFAHLERRGWSPDLALNVDTVLADLLPISPQRAAALLASPTRLVDLLYADDVAIRRAALARLETLSQSKLDLDVAADPYAHAVRVEALRVRLAAR